LSESGLEAGTVWLEDVVRVSIDPREISRCRWSWTGQRWPECRRCSTRTVWRVVHSDGLSC